MAMWGGRRAAALVGTEAGGARWGGRQAGTQQGANSYRSKLLLAYGCRIWAPPRPRPPNLGGSKWRDAVLDDGGERGRGCTRVERERRGSTCGDVAGVWREVVVVLGREEAAGAREAADARQGGGQWSICRKYVSGVWVPYWSMIVLGPLFVRCARPIHVK